MAFRISDCAFVALIWTLLLVIGRSVGDGPSLSGPRFSKDPPAHLDFVGSKGTRINCAATGNPPPSVIWVLIDGSPVTDISRLRKVEALTGGGSALVLSPFKAESFRPDVHSAVYRCVASNVAGVIHSRNVNVNGVVLQNHEILVYDSYAIEGNSAVFKCHVPSVLKDYMTVTAWIKNDNLLIQPAIPEVMNGKFAVMPSGDLHIHDVALSENGLRFKCKAHHRLTGETLISSTDGQLFVTESRGVIAPKIFESPSTVSVENGQVAVLVCVSQGSPLPVVKWFKKDSADERILVTFVDRFVKTSGAMIIRDAVLSDSSTYTCEASSDLGRDVLDIELDVFDVVSAKLEPSVHKSSVGERVVFKCVTTGKLESISWLHNGSPMKTKSGSSLVIDSVQMTDRGMYQCLVKSVGGDLVHDTAELQLSEMSPQFVETFQQIELQPGGSVSLSCAATGIPLPKISWRIDGISLNASSGFRLHSSEDHNGNVVGALDFDKVNVQDGGLYSCVASSESGEAIHSARVNVYGALGIRRVPQILAVSGLNLILNCPIYGFPISSIGWKKDQRQLRSSRVLTVWSNGTLIARHIDRRNGTGTYTCEVQDPSGNKAAADMNVSVLVAPKIVPFEFQDELLREGMRARLQCVVSDGDLPLNITWLKDGKPLSPKLGVLVTVLDEFSSIITINNINPGHNGKYTCVASNQAAIVFHTAQLSVNVVPKIVPFEFGGLQFEGSAARVVCGLQEGDAPIRFSWLRDGVPLTQLENSVSIHETDGLSSVLSFGSLSVEHAGTYTCIAKNRAGVDRHDAQLRVHVPPKVVPFSFQDEHLTEGQLARVSCVVSRGDLPLTLQWEKDDILLKENKLDVKGVDIKSFDNYSSILSITGVAPENNGLYTCVAKNGAGSARHSAQLTVNVPPQWMIKPDNVAVVKGGSCMLHCSVRGFPKPTITWMRVTDASSSSLAPVFTPIQSGPNLRLFENGSLSIANVDQNSVGNYYCEASNGIGSDLNEEVRLSIYVPPFFKQSLSEQVAPLGEEIQLQCWVQGDSPLKVTWYKNGKLLQEIQSRLKIEVKNTTSYMLSLVTIQKVAREDSANFSCLAENVFGTNTSSGNLIVIESPSTPQELKADVVDSRIVELSWKAAFDGNDKILKYVIQHKLESDSWEEAKTMETINGEPTTGIISGLQPATGYIFRLFAENSQGRSPASQILRITTLEDVPSGAPHNLQVEPVNMETFKVLWKAPDDESWNGKIQGYYIGYKETIGTDQYLFKTLMTKEPKADDLYVQIGGLKRFTKYSVVVLAYNSKGKGPQTEPVVVMTSEGAPSLPPTEVRCTTLTSQTIHVIFLVPPPDSVNGILRDYTVIYKPVVDQYEDSREILTRTNSTSMTLSQLQKFTNYSIEVAASTRAGNSPRSVPVHCKTLDDVPGSPTDVKAIITSANSVTVAWKNPENSNGVLKSFTVYWSADSNKNDVASSKVAPNLNYYEVPRLETGRLYYFWVTASTLVGEGQPSKTISQTPNGPSVAAKILSFKDEIVAPWTTEVELACLAVGHPKPQLKWHLRGSVVEESDKVKISSDGTLYLKEAHEEDAGDYTCLVKNDVGEDRITYTVVILSPPAVVKVDVSSISSNAINLKWTTPVSKMTKLKGYILKVKQNDGEWKEIPLGPEIHEYKINSLDCGTPYEVVVFAHNRIGSSAPSELLVISTNGSVPVSPSKSDMIEETSSSVSLYLNTWKNNGCPIKYYVVEYAPKSSNEWTMVSSSVKPEQRRLVIPSLKSATRYNLRMTAHNSAGSTVAKYEFATLTTSGATISPELQSDEPYNRVDSLMTQLNFYLIVPVICTAIVLLAILGVAYMCIKIKQTERRNLEVSRRLAAVYEMKRADSLESFNYMQHGTASCPSSTVKRVPNDITPYATLQLVNHGHNNMDTMGRQCAGPFNSAHFNGYPCNEPQLMDHHFFPPGSSVVHGNQGPMTETTFVFPANPMGNSPTSPVNPFPIGYENDQEK